VVVTSGAHAGLIAALAALSQHGEELLVEPLNYPTLRPIARHLGLTLVPVESDAEGMLPDSVDRAAREGTARMLYVVPSFHNPTTVSLSLARRQALAAIARRHAMTVIEDDIFRLLDARVQPETLFTLAPERTWHVTSVSKTLAPGLRVGFVVTPPGKTETLIRHQTVAAGRAVGLAAEVARHWIAGDAADRILAAIIAENAARRDMAIDIFRGRNFSCAPGAPYLWLRLPEHWPPGEFARAALERGVRLTPGTAFAMARRADDHGVRVCFGGTATRPQLGSALHTINSLLEEAPDVCFAAVA
jgi:DNA-binding transcriptional MocR family regulator